VVQIIADRIEQKDARKGFILDGFPRTVPQAEALGRLLRDRGLKLDGVIELKVDDGILMQRIESRIAQMKARGEPLRADDNPESMKKRLAAYHAQTAPLTSYYRGKGMLRTTDGMAPIDAVTAAIGRLLAPQKAAAPAKAKRARKPAAKARKPARKGPVRRSKAAKSRFRTAAARKRRPARTPTRKKRAAKRQRRLTKRR
jgi:adenylate kinase